MALPMKFPLICFSLVSAGVGVAMCFNRIRWNRNTMRLVAGLERLAPPQEIEMVTFENFDQLPEPVAKYLRFALREGQPFIRSVRIQQVGELRGLEKSQETWMPFQALQFFSALRPGFVWDARVCSFPWMRVRDACVAGQGAAEVSALSLLTLADVHDETELTSGALLRYLAEAVWFPTALLPSSGLTWSPISRHKALATLTDGGITVSLEFLFNDAGEITGVYTPGRYRTVAEKYELTPWGGQHRRYEERNGMRIPTEAEVQWYLPDGERCVWKGRIVNIVYDFAK